MGDRADTTRTVDEATLRYLSQLFGTLDSVTQTSLFPATKQETLLVQLDPALSPDSIDAVRLELRVYTNGDVHVSYLEPTRGEIRRCRWDRHPNDHNSRDHFHPLPNAATATAEDRAFPPDVTALLETVVLPWVDRRIGTLWENID